MFDLAESRVPTSKSSPARLTAFAGDFEHLAAALFALAERAPARLTLRQSLAFSIICYSNAMGRVITMKDLRELTDGVIGQSIEKSIQQFFTPSRDYPDGLGWLEQEADPDDRRKKYLRLTPQGSDCAKAIIESLKEGSLN